MPKPLGYVTIPSDIPNLQREDPTLAPLYGKCVPESTKQQAEDRKHLKSKETGCISVAR